MLILLIGIIGATLILIAFIMNQLERWHDADLIYDWFNAIGAILLILYALFLESIPFMILNSIWAAVSLRDVYIHLFRKNKKKSTSMNPKKKRKKR